MAMRFLLAGSLLVALVAARVPEEQTPLEASAHEVVPLLSEAKNVVKESQLKGSEYSAKISNLCEAEVDAVNAWVEEGLQVERDNHDNQRLELAAALEARVEKLAKVVMQLRGLSSHLKAHLQRVTETFDLMHEAMEQEAVQNARTLEALGVAIGNWDVYKKPSELVKDAATRAQEEALSLLEVAVTESRAMQPTHITTIDGVFANFKRAISLWEPINGDYKSVIELLSKLHDELHVVIDVKLKKLERLREQASLLKSEEANIPQLHEAFKSVHEHRTIVVQACADAKAQSQSAAALKAKILGFISGEGVEELVAAQATGSADVEVSDFPEPITLDDEDAAAAQRVQEAAEEEEVAPEPVTSGTSELGASTVAGHAASEYAAAEAATKLLDAVLAAPARSSLRR